MVRVLNKNSTGGVVVEGDKPPVSPRRSIDNIDDTSGFIKVSPNPRRPSSSSSSSSSKISSKISSPKISSPKISSPKTRKNSPKKKSVTDSPKKKSVTGSSSSSSSKNKKKNANSSIDKEKDINNNGFTKVSPISSKRSSKGSGSSSSKQTKKQIQSNSNSNSKATNKNDDNIDIENDRNQPPVPPPPEPPAMSPPPPSSPPMSSKSKSTSSPMQFERANEADIVGSPRPRPKKHTIAYTNAFQLQPVLEPNNEPMNEITLLIRQPNLKPLKILNVDPANTTIRMIREFLHEHYYKGHIIPRNEQRTLLYNQCPIFDRTGDPNIDDSQTLADHNLIYDPSQIELEFMHVHVIDPSTKQGMTIDNVDPMNDVLLEMRKLAMKDGYNIDKLRVLHKEANYKEIGLDQNSMTFFDCHVKHEHTLILEWPKITIYIKLPRQSVPDDYESDDDDNFDINDDDDDGNDDGNTNRKKKLHTERDEMTGRPYQVYKQVVQAELCHVENIQEFVFNQTGIKPHLQGLFFQNENNPIYLDNPTNVLADYDGMEQNTVIEVRPMTLKVNYRDGGDSSSKVLGSAEFEDIYPNDTIDYIKGCIADMKKRRMGVTKKCGVPTIPTKNQLLSHKGNKLTKQNRQRLFQLNIIDGDELDVEKANITVHVKFPQSKLNSDSKTVLVEIYINPKVDDVETLKEEVSDETDIPIESLPPLRHKGIKLEDDNDLKEYNITENDILEIDPITVKINVVGIGEVINVEGLDPFNDTIDDLKRHLDKDLDVMPFEKQRLLYRNEIVDNDGRGHHDMLSPTLFECGIKNDDTLDLEKYKIDLWIQQPNGERLILDGLDRRNDTLQAVEEFLSEQYYKGKDKDGTVSEDQLRPLTWDGKRLDVKSTKSLLEHNMMEDVCIIQMEPMTVHVNIEADGGGKPKRMTFNNVDPINDNIRELKNHSITSSGHPVSSVKKWVVVHRERDMNEISIALEKLSFYSLGVKEGNNLIIRRQPPIISIQLPHGIIPSRNRDPKGIVKVLPEDEDIGTPATLAIKVNPAKDDFDTLKGYISDFAGFPPKLQTLNRILDGNGNKERLEAVGGTKLSAPELNLVEDSTLELEPPTINFHFLETGINVPVEVLPSDSVEDVKKALETVEGIDIPCNKQRLIAEDGTEIGGEDDNETMSIFFDRGVVKDGDTVLVEKSKITVAVKMPNGMDPVETVVDPKKDDIDEIRGQVLKSSRLPLHYQQRFYLKDNQLMDEGYKPDEEDDGAEGSKRTLVEFNLKDFDTVTLDATRIYVKVLPENDEFTIENVDPLRNTLYDLKVKVSETTGLPAFKFRMLDSKTDKEYETSKTAKETLHIYGIKDGEVVHVERKKIKFKIVLPDLQELTMTVDPRLDDLQKVRDFIFKEYYDERKLPKKAMRQMFRGPVKLLDDEPGERKLIEFGILADGDHVRLKPCPIVIETPKKQIYCTNTDPFHDDLHLITKWVKNDVEVDIDGCHIEYKGKKMTDYSTVLYDLDILDEDVIHYVR